MMDLLSYADAGMARAKLPWQSMPRPPCMHELQAILCYLTGYTNSAQHMGLDSMFLCSVAQLPQGHMRVKSVTALPLLLRASQAQS